jgi:hypothetical protein
LILKILILNNKSSRTVTNTSIRHNPYVRQGFPHPEVVCSLRNMTPLLKEVIPKPRVFTSRARDLASIATTVVIKLHHSPIPPKKEGMFFSDISEAACGAARIRKTKSSSTSFQTSFHAAATFLIGAIRLR